MLKSGRKEGDQKRESENESQKKGEKKAFCDTMHFFFLACLALLAFVQVSEQAYCHGSPADGERTSAYQTLVQSTSDFTLVKEV